LKVFDSKEMYELGESCRRKVTFRKKEKKRKEKKRKRKEKERKNIRFPKIISLTPRCRYSKNLIFQNSLFPLNIIQYYFTSINDCYLINIVT
jgi:hypothetical protein